ncbi:MAG: aminoglycoside phosphotransferase family protein [Actinomycetota bacterium]|nr:aminoglycoside phosphotransferase family protein [Actinomycetota bacterium]
MASERMTLVDDFPMPINLIDDVDRCGDDRRRTWMAALPDAVEDMTERWSIDEVGDPFQPGGQTAWVAPVRVGDDADLVLKVGWRHTEAAHEAAGLTEWDGQGAVRLHASAEVDDIVGLLIERCLPGTSLANQPETEQDVVIAGLLPRLWREPRQNHVFRPLQLMCDEWADEFERKVAGGRGRLDTGLAREGIELFRSLPATAERNVLLCTDLHAGNVLAAEREPWLVIDPKPYVGDATYDPLQHMLNCERRLNADPRGLALRMADLLGLDGERLVLWLFARCVQESPDSPMLARVARRISPT